MSHVRPIERYVLKLTICMQPELTYNALSVVYHMPTQSQSAEMS